MLGNRRSNYDLLQQIVQGCQEPIEITDLYHKIKTQYQIFKRSLNMALQFKLVENIGNKYQTTEKGKRFLIAWEHVQEFLTEEP